MLARKEVPDDVAATVLDKFEAAGLIDDEAFARSWVEARQRTKGLARRALAQELRQKGVDDEVARETLDEVDPETERAAAVTLVRKKLPSLRNADDKTRVRRLTGMLARKGYSGAVAFAVVREELALHDEEMDVDALEHLDSIR